MTPLPTPGADVAWQVPTNTLHQALAAGHWLKVRALLAQGHGVDDHTASLVRQQDLLAGHGLLREAGGHAGLLPGSPWAGALAGLDAQVRGDSLELALEPGASHRGTGGRTRL